MSNSQDPSQKFYQYDSDDRQLLVGLLHEYSDKLVEVSREIYRSRTNKKIKIHIYTPIYFFTGWFASLLVSSFIYINNNGFPSRENLILLLLFNAILASIFVFLTGLAFCTITYFISSYRLDEVKNDLLERDARMIANRLESAMRLTVEIADRVETNLARKLELDLRIDDASSALEYYYLVVDLKSKSQSKSRKTAA